MARISIAECAYAAIVATLPRGATGSLMARTTMLRLQYRPDRAPPSIVVAANAARVAPPTFRT